MIVTLVKRNLRQLANEIIEGLEEKYDLVYVDQGDKLTDTQVAAIVRGDSETLWEETSEFESEGRWLSVNEIIKDDAKLITDRWSREDDVDYDELLDEFDGSDEWQRVRAVIEERDSGSWVKDLMRGNSAVLLRINVLDEDHGYSFQEIQPEQVLTDVGLPVTDDNVRKMRATLAECSPEFSVLLGYWIVGASVEDMYNLPADDDTIVEIVNPYLYLGNPFAGSGWISEEPFEGVVKVKREDLRTDKDAFGYSVNEVYGGLDGSQFECTIRPVPKETE